MSRNDCNYCHACGKRCDKCNAQVCIDNMASHRELFRLKDEFNNKVYNALQNLYEICNIIKYNLFNNYGIYIEISNIYDKIVQGNDFLNKLKIKNEEILNIINNINNEINEVKIKKTEDIANLNKIHEEKMNEENSKFDEDIKQYKIIETKYENEYESKSKKKKELIKIKNEMNIDIDKIIQSFVDEERIKYEKELTINKKEIDNKYKINKINENDFSYNKNELEMKNQCLNEIKKLKDYSDKIPNFDFFINEYGLNNYLN